LAAFVVFVYEFGSLSKFLGRNRRRGSSK